MLSHQKLSKAVTLAASFASLSLLLACGPHNIVHKAKAGDPKTTTIPSPSTSGGITGGGVYGGSLSITNPTHSISTNSVVGGTLVTAAFTINDNGATVQLAPTWVPGGIGQDYQVNGSNFYEVETACANVDCSEFAALFTFGSASTRKNVADLYYDMGGTSGVIIEQEDSTHSYSSVKDALVALQQQQLATP